MATVLHSDVLILGGGIAGLWTLARLRRDGFECVLVEPGSLGCGQTIASQGIIHGGLKYALDGQVGSAATAIASMPGVWRACLAGEKNAPVDLRGVPVLSDHYFYWTAPGVMSRVAGATASKLLRTAVDRVGVESRPAVLRGAPSGLGGVDVYSVGEMVLDARELVQKLAASVRGRAVHGSFAGMGASGRDGAGVRIRCNDGREIEVRTRAVVLCAGSGNEELLAPFGVHNAMPVRAQRRPLHMVMARGVPGPFFGHCVGTSSSPRITITSGTHNATGEHVWYIGGQVAEDGVSRSAEEQVTAARRELAECMPWLTLSEDVRWATLRVDRAEGVPERAGAMSLMPGSRPDVPVVVRAGHVLAAWPTKLAFAPLLGDEVARQLGEMGVRPRADGSLDPAIPCAPTVAPHVWDREDIEWR